MEKYSGSIILWGTGFLAKKKSRAEGNVERCYPSIGQILAAMFLIGAFVCGSSAEAGNWLVRPAASGSANGSNWNNAWSMSGISWASVAPGDVVWLAGGTYTVQLHPNKSGTSSNPIFIKRATASD